MCEQMTWGLGEMKIFNLPLKKMLKFCISKYNYLCLCVCMCVYIYSQKIYILYFWIWTYLRLYMHHGMRWKADQAAVWCMCVLWNCNHLQCWALKNWYFQIMVLEKNPENPLDGKEIKPANPKGNQPWIFIGRTDAETPILWPPDAKGRPIGKDHDAGID